MAVSKQHYMAVAKILRLEDIPEINEYSNTEDITVLGIIDQFVDYFKASGSGFNEERFLEACNYYQTAMGVRTA